ncbi:MAG: MBL fold metallo-hydrolase, partial [Lentisphaeria bacterium]|nr:MBL fold metallo-hydrolase [Lentisphaeria bacterium]
MIEFEKHIKVIPVGMLETNCVLIKNPASNILYVIDPGGEPQKILRKIDEFENVSAVRIVLTHAHFDHISGAGQVAQALNLDRVYVGKKDIPLYLSPDNAYPP